MGKFKSILGAFVIGTLAITSASATNQLSLIHHWQDLTLKCNGGRGNYPATMAACDQANIISTKLEKRGCNYQLGFTGLLVLS